jgi:hypothetical protein
MERTSEMVPVRLSILSVPGSCATSSMNSYSVGREESIRSAVDPSGHVSNERRLSLARGQTEARWELGSAPSMRSDYDRNSAVLMPRPRTSSHIFAAVASGHARPQVAQRRADTCNEVAGVDNCGERTRECQCDVRANTVAH